ncbi:2-(1,2-epoxy-1,2-dihydrophenyl)acetyl-CoA isomerase PaaG [Zavarzinia sp. CC-PAN008]|uniref:2-(1,2-epoxy-1,2-dihydrophenyl)acetyl-CoA isomerase PaaG n=1 Tax=Zavarzinia sp. CC-PAN008 TaxID=3243332 RepID=UPI003F742985
MGFATIQFTLDGGIARLALNRPDKLNSFTAEMHGEIAQALTRIEAEGARVLLLTGAGRGFCAGQDLADPAIAPGQPGHDLGTTIETHYNPLVRRLAALPLPVVAAVNGVAAGAGANLAFGCDIVIAARSARFIQSFANIGLVPDGGGTWILPRLAGQARAMGLALTGQPLPAEQAAAWGLIWSCVDDDKLMAEAEALVARFATAPTRGLAATKKALRAAWGADLSTQLDLERDLQREMGTSADYQEGVAAFLEKRKPAFTGA